MVIYFFYFLFLLQFSFIIQFIYLNIENISPSRVGMKSNGLAFDIILDNPKGKTPAKLTPYNTPTKTLTNEDIKNKLVKAEERRQVINFIKTKMKKKKQ